MSILHVSDFHVGKDDEIKRKKIENLVEFLNKNEKKITHIVFSGDVIDARRAVITTRSMIIKDLDKTKVSNFKNKKTKEINKKITKKEINPIDVYIEFPSLKKVTYSDFIKKEKEYIYCLVNHDNTFEEFIESEGLVDKYKELLNDNRAKLFKRAEELFRVLRIGLDVHPDNIIICPGNHDVSNYTETEECDEYSIVRKYDGYELFDNFCKEITSKVEPDYRKNMVVKDDYSFIVLNSNWNYRQIKSKEGKCCIDCNSLKNVIKENKYTRNKTIVVCHKPVSEFCENARLSFIQEDADTKALKENFINEMCSCASLFLCGDLHAAERIILENNTTSCMAGSLSMEGCAFYIIDMVKKGQHKIETIRCYNSNWYFNIDKEKCSESYILSKDYLKNMAFEMIEGDRNANIQGTDYSNLITSIYNCDDNRKKNIESFFKTIISRENPENISVSDVFVQENAQNIIEVTGITGVGKSSLLSYVYLRLLYLADKQQSGILPFYFNFNIDEGDLPKIPTDCNFFEVLKNKVKQFEDFYQKAKTISDESRILLIVDGLDGKANWTKEIAKGIDNQVLSFLNRNYNEKTDRIVLGISSFKNRPNKKYSLEEIEYEKIEKKIIVNPIKLEADFKKLSKNKGKEEGVIASQKIINIFQCYGDIFSKKISEETINEIVKKCLSSGIVNMSLSFLRYLVEHSDNLGKNLYNTYLLKNYHIVTKGMEEDIIQKLRKVAYKYLYTDTSFDDLVNDKNEDIDISFALNFQLIKDKPDLQIYLAAEYYYKKLTEIKNSSSIDEEDEKYSILYNFFDKDLSCIVRFIMEQNGDYDKFRTWFDKHYEEDFLSKQLYCTLRYLLSRSKDKGNRKLERKLADANNIEYDAFYMRANGLSDWMIARSLEDGKENYIKTLFLNTEARLFNRQYMRYYYRELLISGDSLSKPWSDGMLNEKISDKEDVSESNLHYCYFSIRNSLSAIDKIDHVSLFYLFTLCDLVYSELQNENSSSLFVDEEKVHLAMQMLNESIDLIDRILELPVDSENRKKSSNKLSDRREETYRILEIYFRYMKYVFEYIRDNFDKEESKNYCNALSQFKRMISVQDCFRCGWKIKKREINLKGYRAIKKRNKGYTETYQEFLFEIINLAQMILPATLNDRVNSDENVGDYKKELVLQMLIMYPTGFYGREYDITPLLSDVDLRMESEKIKETIKFNVIFNILEGYDQYELLKAISKKDDINNIIFEEIKIIFLEYKYYRLLKEGELNCFTEERKEMFIKDFENSRIKYLSYERENLLKYLK